MAILTYNCPHCGTASVGFTTDACVAHPNSSRLWTVFLHCPACFGGLVCVTDNGGSGRKPTDHAGNLRERDLIGSQHHILSIYPQTESTDVPDALPDRVAKAFKEGCEVLGTSANAACAQFRRALEMGLKDLSPEIEAWKLEKRIDKLAAAHLLTPAIKEWAHRLRLDGNEAVHGDEDATPEMAVEMRELTRYVLLYLYTLPSQVAAASGQADAERQ